MNQPPNGIYRYGESPIHKLDATVKIVVFIILIAAAIAASSLLGYAALIVFTAITAFISKIGFNAAAGNLKRMIWFFVIVFFMNLCFFNAEDAWIKFWIFSPSYTGLMQGLKVVVRVAVVLVLCNILNATTPPVSVTDALENIISPLKRIKVPVNQIALIISIAIQFIPTLLEETDIIRKTQTARGAKFESRKLRDKAGAVIPMVVPIFISAFKHADELSIAMEARGYRVDINYKKSRKLNISGLEIISFILCTALLMLQITVF